MHFPSSLSWAQRFPPGQEDLLPTSSSYHPTKGFVKGLCGELHLSSLSLLSFTCVCGSSHVFLLCSSSRFMQPVAAEEMSLRQWANIPLGGLRNVLLPSILLCWTSRLPFLSSAEYPLLSTVRRVAVRWASVLLLSSGLLACWSARPAPWLVALYSHCPAIDLQQL